MMSDTTYVITIFLALQQNLRVIKYKYRQLTNVYSGIWKQKLHRLLYKIPTRAFTNWEIDPISDSPLQNWLYFFFFYSCIVPLEFLPWQIHVTFPRERQLWQSRYQTYGACWVFRCFHNPSNSDMDYRIFNVHTDVDACSYTQGCTDSIRESSLKVHSGRPIPCRTVNQTYLSGVPVQRSTKWAKPSFFLRLVQISESTFLFRCLIYRHNSSRDFTLH